MSTTDRSFELYCRMSDSGVPRDFARSMRELALRNDVGHLVRVNVTPCEDGEYFIMVDDIELRVNIDVIDGTLAQVIDRDSTSKG